MRSRTARAGMASCLAALCFAAAPVRADEPRPEAAPDPARIEEAKRHMKAGAAFYNDPSGHKCEEALREFNKAYQLSGSLNALKGMAICDFELERDGESIELYQAYLDGKHGNLDPAERAQVEADLTTLRASVAKVRLSADRPGARVTDVRTPARGFPIRNTYSLPGAGTQLGIHPGQHVFTASVEGMPDRLWRVEIANGGTYTHTFVFGPHAADPAKGAEPVERPIPVAFYVTAGLTVALAAPWAVLAVHAKNLNDEYSQANGKEPAAQLEDLRSGVKNANLLADVFLGATLASLTATAVLFFARPSKPARSKSSASPGMAVGVSSGPAPVKALVAAGWF